MKVLVSLAYGGGGGGDTTQRTEPPAFLLPYLKQAASTASNLFQQGPFRPPTESAIAPFNPAQLLSQQLLAQQATGQTDVSALFPQFQAPSFSNSRLGTIPAPTTGTGQGGLTQPGTPVPGPTVPPPDIGVPLPTPAPPIGGGGGANPGVDLSQFKAVEQPPINAVAGSGNQITGQIPQPTVPSIPGQVTDAVQAQANLLQGAQSAVNNPFVQAATNQIQGINQLGGPANAVQNQLFAQAFGGGNQFLDQATQAAAQAGEVPGGQLGELIQQAFFTDPSQLPGVQGTQQAIARQVNQQLNEQTLPAVGDAAVGSGQFGSSRQGVSEGIARRGASNAIADANARVLLQAQQAQQAQRASLLQQLTGQQFGAGQQQANILSGAFGQGLGAAGQALAGQRQADITGGQAGADLFSDLFGTTNEGQLRSLLLAPQTAQLSTLPSQLLGQLGAQQQGQQQALTDESLNRFLQVQQGPNQNLQNFLANLGVISPQSGSVTQGSGGGLSRGQSALGGAASGAALGTQILPGWGTAIGAVAGALLGGAG